MYFKVSILILVVSLIASGPIHAGDLTDRFKLTLERVLNGEPPHYSEDFLLADVIPKEIRRFTNFSGDLSGRYIGALAASSYRDQQLATDLIPLVTQILQHQNQDGHFGDPMGASETTEDDMARLWGNGRMLIGLLEYYKTTNHQPALEAAKKIGDFLVEVSLRFNAPSLRRFFLDKKFAVGYICWTQNIEGLTALYRLVPNARYLTLAEQMAERIERRKSQHSHGLLTSLRGLVDLSRITKKSDYLQQAEKMWREIITSGNLLIHGAIPEAFLPSIERDEGCAQADWIRLNLDLWHETRNTRYLAQAERTLFNAFSMNQFSTGDFGHIELRETGIGPQMTRAWWCCTLHGLRTFPAIERNVFHFDDGTIYYNVPVDGTFDIAGTKITANSSLQQDTKVILSITQPQHSSVRLAVRLPKWAKSIHISVKGEPQAIVTVDDYVHIKKSMAPVTEIQLSYSLRTHLEKHPNKNGYTAIFYGPWLLGVAESSTPSFFDEPYGHNIVIAPDTARVSSPSAIRQNTLSKQENVFQVPAAHLNVKWVPAGYRTQPQIALLRPLAEATGESSSTRWEFWLKTAEYVHQSQIPGRSNTDGKQLHHLYPWSIAIVATVLVIFLIRQRKR
jgi:DUF1680 family protein